MMLIEAKAEEMTCSLCAQAKGHVPACRFSLALLAAEDFPFSFLWPYKFSCRLKHPHHSRSLSNVYAWFGIVAIILALAQLLNYSRPYAPSCRSGLT